jgi:hypothetical protein
MEMKEAMNLSEKVRRKKAPMLKEDRRLSLISQSALFVRTSP